MESVKERRAKKRKILLMAAFGAGILLMFFGGDALAWFIPAKYFGFFIFLFSIFGFSGFNVWVGTDLDPRFDNEILDICDLKPPDAPLSIQLAGMSVYGTGFVICGIDHRQEGIIEFSVWFRFFCFPIFPIASWSGIYVKEFHRGNLMEGQPIFENLQRVNRALSRHFWTYWKGCKNAAKAMLPVFISVYISVLIKPNVVGFLIAIMGSIWTAIVLVRKENDRKQKLYNSKRNGWDDFGQ